MTMLDLNKSLFKLINLKNDTQFFFVTDYVVAGSDSGRIVILEYLPSKNSFERVSLVVINCIFLKILHLISFDFFKKG